MEIGAVQEHSKKAVIAWRRSNNKSRLARRKYKQTKGIWKVYIAHSIGILGGSNQMNKTKTKLWTRERLPSHAVAVCLHINQRPKRWRLYEARKTLLNLSQI